MRSVYYDGFRWVHHWYFGEGGERLYERVQFTPYIFVECLEAEEQLRGMFGASTKIHQFPNNKERREYLRHYEGKVYLNLPVEQQFLLLRYPEGIPAENPLRAVYLDIEVEVHKGDPFPHADIAPAPINALSVYDSLAEKYVAWGIGEFDPPDDVLYVRCADEVEILRSFLEFWCADGDHPDLVVGWNSASFDLPYIYNRIRRNLGDADANSLSPISRVREIERKNKFGHEYQTYNIAGVNHLDFMEVADYMHLGNLPSRRLDAVCELYGVGRKIEHEHGAAFAEFAERDHQRFMEYNVHDVRLMVELEEKTNYLSICRTLTGSGYCTLDKALGKTAIISGEIARRCFEDGVAMFTQHRTPTHKKIAGGFVRNPSIGFQKDFCVFDVASLYPNTIITLNISPETKVGKVYHEDDDEVKLTLRGESVVLPRSMMADFFREAKICRSARGDIFDNSSVGVYPKFLDEGYGKRKEAKAEMAKCESGSEDYRRHDILQSAIKTVLNSAYGALANRWFPLYDLDCAESVTLTGQAMIKEAARAGVEYVQRVDPSVKEDDLVIFGDTDSVAFSMEALCRAKGVEFCDGDHLTDAAREICVEFETHLTDSVNDYARDVLFSTDPRWAFEAEEFASVGIFTAKKHYAIRLLDTPPGKDPIKARGLAIRKSNYSDEVKELLHRILEEGFLASCSRVEIDAMFRTAYEEFCGFPPSAVTLRQNIRSMDNYEEGADGFHAPKGTPYHVKAAINHNALLRELEITAIPPIQNSDKIKVVKVGPNEQGITEIAFLDDLPEEFGLAIDYGGQWERLMKSNVGALYKAMGWAPPDVVRQGMLSEGDFMAELFGPG